MSEAPFQSKPSRRRRGVVFSVVTIIVAGLWAGSTYAAAEKVREYNGARIWTSMMAPGAMGTLFGQADPAALEKYERLQRGIGYVESVVHYWERTMYGVAGFLALVGVLSLATRASRPLHLVAAIVMPASAVASLVALALVCDPDKGGMPPLSPWTSVIVVAAQSFYGIVLLFAFAPRRRSRVPDSGGADVEQGPPQ